MMSAQTNSKQLQTSATETAAEQMMTQTTENNLSVG